MKSDAVEQQDTPVSNENLFFGELQTNADLQKNRLEEIKNLTEQEIERLANQEYSVVALQSNLGLLLKRYNLEKSFFGQTAAWYGEKSWWIKIFLFILVAGIAAGIGFLCHMPITVISITIAIQIFFVLLFINHYTIERKQTKLLCEDILEMEKSLTASLNHFNELSLILKKNLITLHQFHSQRLQDLELFQQNVAALKKELAQYKSIIRELEQTKHSIIESTEIVQKILIKGKDQYADIYSLLHNQAAKISVISESLAVDDKSLQHDLELLKSVAQNFQQLVTKLRLDISNYEQAVTEFQTLVNSTTARNNQAFDTIGFVANSTAASESQRDPSQQDASTILVLQRSNRNISSEALQLLQHRTAQKIARANIILEKTKNPEDVHQNQELR